MKVFGTGPQPFQHFPFLKDRARGCSLWWRGGDVFSPSGWNTRGRFGFYIGWKAFGADSDAYKDFPGINADEIYSGSVALTGFTARFTTKLAIP